MDVESSPINSRRRDRERALFPSAVRNLVSSAGVLRPELWRCTYTAFVPPTCRFSFLRFCEDAPDSSSNDNPRLRFDCIEALLAQLLADGVIERVLGDDARKLDSGDNS